MKKILLFFVFDLFAALNGCLWANGDPVAVHSALTLSPTPVAVHIPEVQLIDEHVTFVPHGLYTEVTVHYLLFNNSKKNMSHIPYGFPIDYYGKGAAYWDAYDEYSESIQESGWRDEFIKGVCFALNDRQLQWQCSRDTLLVPAKKFVRWEELDDGTMKRDKADEQRLLEEYGESIYYYSTEISRRWYYTYLDIPAGKVAELEVRYMVFNTYTEYYAMISPAIYTYNPELMAEFSFRYDFTPAAYWGNGHADHFCVVVDASEVKRPPYSEEAPLLNGRPMLKEGNLWKYEEENFDLAKADGFEFSFWLKENIRQSLSRILNSRLTPDKYSITVSGADKKYPVKNLTDMDLNTTLVLRPDKRDSLYITIKFKEPTRVTGLVIYNGYTKNAETWRNNSRIDSIYVVGSWTEEFEAEDEQGNVSRETLDYNCEYIVSSSYWDQVARVARRVPMKCPSDEPRSFDWQTLTDNAILVPIGRITDTPLSREYTIIIPATIRGKKYDDLCISEILVLGDEGK